MAGLCEGGNEPPGSLKDTLKRQLQGTRKTTVPVSDHESDEIELDTDYDVFGVLSIFADSESHVEKKTKSVKLMLKAHIRGNYGISLSRDQNIARNGYIYWVFSSKCVMARYMSSCGADDRIQYIRRGVLPKCEKV
ncbi:hypothetical protein ANN_26582 [Periplaneta americana]|uniref:Uncharacterized protein n=1 Tax=Periplaneta americana TaxID=6978 RepID=A0ABQ8RYM8_PERAM|nr:hypothetical protein ANN_26582 [Periplaneta americana]